MTIEETKEAIKVMQAYVDGKKIEVLNPVFGTWQVLDEPPVFDWLDCQYRISPNQDENKEKKYRPYTMEEFVEDMHKHDGFIRYKHHSRYGHSINYVGCGRCILNDDTSRSYTELMNYFVWSDDGQPCGKEVTK